MPRTDVPRLVDAEGPDVVTLRAHHDDDVDRVLEQCRDPMSLRWTTVPTPYNRDDAARFVRHAMPGGWASDEEWGFAVDVAGRFGGTVSLRNHRGRPAEVAYGAHPDVRGTGAMERAIRLLVEWGFAERGLPAIQWWANRGNWASRRLAWKVGFDITPTPVRGYLDHRGEWTDAWLGMLLPADARLPRTPWLVVPRIDSPRLPLRLRAFGDDDVPRIVEAVSDAETRSWLGRIPDQYDAGAAHVSLLTAGELAACGRGLTLAVADTHDDRLLGRLDLFDVDGHSAELGFWTHPAERGRGVVTEAARLVARHALVPTEDGGLGLARVGARVAAGNAASVTALERAGFARVGVERRGVWTRAGAADAVVLEALS